ncbi:hypothetical protein AB4Y87_12310 [Paenarthrobacter sp. RAF54_2]|uniref:hypothetical protein n=1 Tax=Paenarthrobacter sp. RAF54_2 TaxID=3233061 RepID=UPI003F9B8943
MSESADAARISLLELAAQLVAVSTSTEGTLAARMSDRFPWMLALSPADREVAPMMSWLQPERPSLPISLI